MARVGFRKAKYNQIDYSTHKYKTLGAGNTVPVFMKVVDEKFAPEFNSAELYANDSLAESDYSFKKGTLTFTVSDDEDKKCGELLGNTVVTNSPGAGPETYIVTSSINDVAPEFGYGHIVKKKVNGALIYKVEFFPRVKFTKITTDNKSRGESVEFGTTTIEGVVHALDEVINGEPVGVWEKHQTFDSESVAENYLDSLLTPSNTSV